MLDVLTITLNPAIDQTVHIDDFKIDNVNRVNQIQNDPGGKGINVASYLASSNLKVGATGFLGIKNCKLFKNIFNILKIEDKFIYISGETRTNIKIVDNKNKTVTDINQSGFDISSTELAELEKVLFSKKEASWYVFSGSLPKGISSDIYKQWIEKAHKLGIKVALDASGDALSSALKSKPNLIKPNHIELSQIAAKDLTEISEFITYSNKLIEDGIETVCVSMGEEGALLIKKDEVYHSIPSKVDVNTTVGAGDAMLSGLILSEINEFSAMKSIKLATAYSMSAVETIGPYLSSKEKIEKYCDGVKIISLK